MTPHFPQVTCAAHVTCGEKARWNAPAINIRLRWSRSYRPYTFAVTEFVLREFHQISIRFAAGPTKKSAKIGAYTTWSSLRKNSTSATQNATTHWPIRD